MRDEESRDWEPRDPETWLKSDPLWPMVRELASGLELEQFEDRVGWTFAAWTHLGYQDRLRVLVERAIVAALLRKSNFRDFSDLLAVGVQLRGFQDLGLSYYPRYWRGFFPYDYVATINVTTPTMAVLVDQVEIDANELLLAAEVLHGPSGPSVSIPVIVQYLPRPIEFTQVGQPTETSAGAGGNLQALHPSDVVDSVTPAGLQRPGVVTAFGKDNSSNDPLVLGAGHVLGNVGNTVNAFGRKIGRVTKVDATLDAAIAELDSPWSIDYRVRTLGIVPAAPLLPTASMNVQFVDRHGAIQVGYVWQTNLVAPGQSTIGFTPNFTCSCTSAGGDSGALIMTGHHGTSAVQHYARATSAGVVDMYRAAMLGQLSGGAGGGPAAVPPQTWGIPMVEILASLGVEPLHR